MNEPDRTQPAERHLDMLEQLATLAMALSRAAAEKAQLALDDLEPDPVLAFTRLAGIVRQIIALEARIVAGPRLAPTAGDEPDTDPAPERDGAAPARCEPHDDERIDADELARLLDQNVGIDDILAVIRDTLGNPASVPLPPPHDDDNDDNDDDDGNDEADDEGDEDEEEDPFYSLPPGKGPRCGPRTP